MAPQTPYGSRTASAWVRHSVSTGQVRQTVLAASSRLRRAGPRSPSGWKNTSGLVRRQAPSSCQSHRSAIGPGRREISAMAISFSAGPVGGRPAGWPRAVVGCRFNRATRSDRTLQPRQRLFKKSRHRLFNSRTDGSAKAGSVGLSARSERSSVTRQLGPGFGAEPLSGCRLGRTFAVLRVAPGGPAAQTVSHAREQVEQRPGAGMDRTAAMAGTGQAARTLTVAVVARRLGVAPATLRTWARRYDLGPSTAHRRLAPALHRRGLRPAGRHAPADPRGRRARRGGPGGPGDARRVARRGRPGRGRRDRAAPVGRAARAARRRRTCRWPASCRSRTPAGWPAACTGPPSRWTPAAWPS